MIESSIIALDMMSQNSMKIIGLMLIDMVKFALLAYFLYKIVVSLLVLILLAP